ncbi:hypothetical protein MUP77_21105 [Candidatus Bathyarchaeota archaeon]|nr:hypothetical protein [Candidatus Bathyarchaeota archaeon]
MPRKLEISPILSESEPQEHLIIFKPLTLTKYEMCGMKGLIPIGFLSCPTKGNQKWRAY